MRGDISRTVFKCLSFNSQTLYPSEERVPLLPIPLIPSPLIPSIKVRIETLVSQGWVSRLALSPLQGEVIYYPHSSDRKTEAPRVWNNSSNLHQWEGGVLSCEQVCLRPQVFHLTTIYGLVGTHPYMKGLILHLFCCFAQHYHLCAA